MLILYYFLFVLIVLICVFIGHSFSSEIYNPLVYILFWIVYLITLLTLGNTLINLYVYMTTKKRKGPIGEKGERGPDGDDGEEGNCDSNCKINLHLTTIMDDLNKHYNNILNLKIKKTETPLKIENKYIKDTLRRICESKQFKELSQTQNVIRVIKYIIEIFKKWISLLANADKSEGKKHFKDYMEIYGEQVQWEFITNPKNNPFNEIEKYDIFYWGLNKEFHPIKFKHCAASNPNKSNLPIIADDNKVRVLETNLYKQTYTDRKTGSKKSLSVWLTSPIKIEDETFYPIGSVFNPSHKPTSNKRYIKQVGNYNKPYTNEIILNNNGPAFSNIVISDKNKKFVRKPPAKAWSWKWNDKKTGGKQSVSFWNAEDFQEDGELFRCFGSMTMPNHNMNNTPTQQLGRDKVPVVCINDKILEEIPNNHTPIWNDKGSRGKYSSSAWANINGSYNLGYFQKGYLKDNDRKSYKIKNEYMNDVPIETNKTITHNDTNLAKEVGFQIPEYNFKRERKNSIFDLLDLVIESDIESLYDGDKLYIQHSGLNEPNSYLIKQYNKVNNKLRTDDCLKINELSNSDSILKATCNPTKNSQLWEIEFIEQSTELCLIKSKENGKYLLNNGKSKYSANGNINKKNQIQFTWKIIQKP